jgi:hypothetical protein
MKSENFLLEFTANVGKQGRHPLAATVARKDAGVEPTGVKQAITKRSFVRS